MLLPTFSRLGYNKSCFLVAESCVASIPGRTEDGGFVKEAKSCVASSVCTKFL